MINLKILPAQYGDCFLLSVKDDGRAFNVLIDGGLGITYEKFLRNELRSIATQNQKIDLMICTHIDADHINGLIAFLRENNIKKFIDVENIWFNGFEQIVNRFYLDSKNIPLKDDVTIIDEINRKGYEDEFAKKEDVGPVEGVAFSSLIEYGRYNQNIVSSGGPITNRLGVINVSENIKINIISPCPETLCELEKEWLNELAAKGFQFSIANKTKMVSSFEFLISRIKRYYEKNRIDISAMDCLENYKSDLEKVDTSIVNNSSIVFVLEAYGKKLLFMGDSVVKEENECKIIQSLLKKYGNDVIFDLIKLPHHGSCYNISNDFIECIKSKEYIVSSNSEKFGHPDMDVIANIILKSKVIDKIMTFNYPVKQANFILNESWKQKYRYKTIFGTGTNIIERKY